MSRWRLLASVGVLLALVVWGGRLVPLTAESGSVTSQTLLGAASLLATKASAPSNTMRSCQESALYLEWGTGVASGAVTIESSFDGTWTGTWAPLAVVTFAGTAPKADLVQITGIHGALQTRISTVVSGGTVTTRLRCN